MGNVPEYSLKELQEMAYPEVSGLKNDPSYSVQELQQMAKTKPSAAEMNDIVSKGFENLENFRPITEQSYDPKIVNASLETMGKNAINEASLGYYPQLAASMKSPFSNDSYLKLRDQEIASLSQLNKENPDSALAGKIGGIGGTMLIPVGAVSKGAGLISKMARGAAAGGALTGASNPGDVEGVIDPLQAGERLQNAKTGAMIGSAVPVAAKIVGSAAESNFGQKALKKISDSAIVKQSGAMLKDFRNIANKGKLEELANTLKNETVEITRDGHTIIEKMYRAGDTFDDIAEKSLILKENTGKRIGQVYEKIDDKLSDPNFIIPEASAKNLAQVQRFNPVTDAPEISQMIAEKYGKKLDGEKVVDRVNGILKDFNKRSDSLTDALELKGELDEMINYAKKTQELPKVQQALIDVRNFIRDKTNKYVETAAVALKLPEAKGIQALNKTYGNASTISEIASDRVNRESANRMFGLTDYLAGGAVGTVAGVSKDGISPESLGYGLAGAIANKGVRKYGPGLLSGVTGAMAKSAQAVSPFNQNILLPTANLFGNAKNAAIVAEAIKRPGVKEPKSNVIERQLDILGNKNGK